MSPCIGSEDASDCAAAETAWNLCLCPCQALGMVCGGTAHAYVGCDALEALQRRLPTLGLPDPATLPWGGAALASDFDGARELFNAGACPCTCACLPDACM